MTSLKFSKKIISILFLLAALLIALFLGSYNFLVVNTNASLPHVLETFDSKSTTPVSADQAIQDILSSSGKTTPTAASPISAAETFESSKNSKEANKPTTLSHEDVSKLLSQYMASTKETMKSK